MFDLYVPTHTSDLGSPRFSLFYYTFIRIKGYFYLLPSACIVKKLVGYKRML